MSTEGQGVSPTGEKSLMGESPIGKTLRPQTPPFKGWPNQSELVSEPLAVGKTTSLPRFYSPRPFP